MVYSIKTTKYRIQPFFYTLSSCLISLITSRLIHLPKHPWPESIGPKTDSPRGICHIIIFAFMGGIRNYSSNSATFCFHFHQKFLIYLIQPLMIGTFSCPFFHEKSSSFLCSLLFSTKIAALILSFCVIYTL